MPHITLQIRLAIGIAIFIALALSDLYKNGKSATRWREYLFLLTCVVAAMVYGVLNDQVSSAISWEYFYYGKELAPILGADVPPDTLALHLQAARIGAEATWSAGLIAGAAILFANSLRRSKYPPLSFASLFKRVASIVPFCIGFGILFAILGHAGYLNWIAEDFRELEATNLWRPRRFMTTYGLHLGNYIGGVVGTVYAVAKTWGLRISNR